MAHNTFECVDHISSETLSAWRDDHLPPAELARLGPHVAICAACQARLAGFDEVARALLRQRNLDPGDRILDGVRRRAAQRPQRGRLLHGRVWGELGALGSVAAVLILFIYVVAVLGVGRGHPIGPAGPKTPVASHTASPAPTGTPTFSPVVAVQTAWGSHAASTSFAATIDATHVFEASAITPDGRYLLGYEVTRTSSGIAENVPAQAGLLTVSTRHFTAIGVSDPASYPPGCCETDGRYLVAVEDTQPGATCGLCHRQYWLYDLATGQLSKIARGTDFGMIQNVSLSNGVLLLMTGQGMLEDQLATQRIGPLPGVPSSASLSAFSWPYLVYLGAERGGTVHVRNLATQQDVALPALAALDNPSNGSEALGLAGDTLFVTVTVTDRTGNPTMATLYELDTVMSGTAQPREIATYQGGLTVVQGANDRVVSFSGVVWDRAEHQFVQVGGQPVNPSEGNVVAETLSGSYLLAVAQGGSPSGAGAPNVAPEVTIYNTATLPVTTGG